MGKLVIYLADGGTVDVVLDKERITIGRRPDNDVCLPFPAVSGEHAQVVTILADSFLEDLGSTNGTIVNGKPVAKHFLRDRDAIDIGRQRLTYLDDNDAKVDALPPDMVLRQQRGMPERVEGVKAVPRPAVSVGPRRAPARTGAAAADLEQVLAEGAEAAVIAKRTPTAPGMGKAAPGESSAARTVAVESNGGNGLAVERSVVEAAAGDSAVQRPVSRPPGSALPVEPSRQEALAQTASTPANATSEISQSKSPAHPGPSVRVLSGASQGRTVAFPGTDLTVGRVGVQVAVVRKLDGGRYLLIPLEGREAPRINGAAVAPDGSPLHPGDTFEVAGVRLELSVGS